MEPNKNNIILIQENQTKLENTISCERCKNTLSTIFCEECKPFHYFCDQCDTSVHDLVTRKNHHRENLSSIDYYSNQNTSTKRSIINNNINNNKYLSTKSFNNNYNIYENFNKEINDNNDNNEESKININTYKTQQKFSLNKGHNYLNIKNDDYSKKVYSKEYINELNNLHEKEKEELFNKIATLQNTLNRIKSSLNDEISKIKFAQITTEKEYNDKIDKIKLGYETKINNLEKEKDYQNKEILNLNQIINEQKKLNEELSSSFEQLKSNYDNLQNQYKLLNKEYSIFQTNSKHENENIQSQLNSTIESFDKYKEITNEKIEK